MTEPTYSIKEIIELQFLNLSKEVTEIKQLLKDQNVQVEKRFSQMEKDIDGLRSEIAELNTENARYKLIFGLGNIVVGGFIAALMAYVVTRITN